MATGRESIPRHLVTPPGLELRDSSVGDGTEGVFCLTAIAAGQLYGPYAGEVILEGHDSKVNYRYAWEVYDSESNELMHIINATKAETGNWMRYVNCARYFEEQNIVSVQVDSEIFYKAIRDIPAGEELLTWFSLNYQMQTKKRKKRKSADSQEEKEPGSNKRKKKPPLLAQSSSMVDDMGTPLLYEMMTSDNKDKTLSKAATSGTEKPCKLSKSKSTGSLDVDMLKGNAKTPGTPTKKPQTANNTPVKDAGPGGATVSNTPGSVTKKSPTPKKALKVKDLIAMQDAKQGGPVKGESSSAKKLPLPRPKSAHQSPKVKDTAEGGADLALSGMVLHSKHKPDRVYQFELRPENHTKGQDDQKTYVCDICHSLYNHAFSLKRHFLRSHINAKYLPLGDITNCLINVLQQEVAVEDNKNNDKRQSKSPGTLQDDDKDDVPLSGVYRCHICCELFDGLDNLREHTQNHPSKNRVAKRFTCEKCDMKFNHKHNLVRHFDTHSDHDCPMCGKIFNRESNMKKHLKFHYNKTFACDLCDEKFTTTAELRKHVRMEHSGTESKMASRQKALNAAKERKESAETSMPKVPPKMSPKMSPKMAKLDVRRKRMKKKKQAVEKKNVQTVQPEKNLDAPDQYPCPICMKLFSTQSSMKKHVQFHGNRRFTCKYCAEKFPHPFGLRKHLWSEHTAQMKLNLNRTPGVIRKMPTFSSKKVETYAEKFPELAGVVKAKVEVDKMIARPGPKEPTSVNKAIKVESVDKPFSCRVCGKRFPSESNMKMHLQYHFGRTFSCRFCFKKFPHPASLRKHLNSEHPEGMVNGVLIKKKPDIIIGPDGKKLTRKRRKKSEMESIFFKEEVQIKEEIVDAVEETKVKEEKEEEVQVREEEKPEEYVMEHPDDSEEEDLWEEEIRITKELQKKSRLHFACIVCKKKFNTYVNMCRHKRLAHRVKKYGIPTLSRQRIAAKMQDCVVVNDYLPITPAEYYSNVADNIATNLDKFIDGKQSALTNYEKNVKIPGYECMVAVAQEKEASAIEWSKYNFPKWFTPWKGISGYDINEDLLVVYDKIELSRDERAARRLRRSRSSSDVSFDMENKEAVDENTNKDSGEMNDDVIENTNKDSGEMNDDVIETTNKDSVENNDTVSKKGSVEDTVDENTNKDSVKKDTVNKDSVEKKNDVDETINKDSDETANKDSVGKDSNKVTLEDKDLIDEAVDENSDVNEASHKDSVDKNCVAEDRNEVSFDSKEDSEIKTCDESELTCVVDNIEKDSDVIKKECVEQASSDGAEEKTINSVSSLDGNYVKNMNDVNNTSSEDSDGKAAIILKSVESVERHHDFDNKSPIDETVSTFNETSVLENDVQDEKKEKEIEVPVCEGPSVTNSDSKDNNGRDDANSKDEQSQSEDVEASEQAKPKDDKEVEDCNTTITIMVQVVEDLSNINEQSPVKGDRENHEQIHDTEISSSVAIETECNRISIDGIVTSDTVLGDASTTPTENTSSRTTDTSHKSVTESHSQDVRDEVTGVNGRKLCERTIVIDADVKECVTDMIIHCEHVRDSSMETDVRQYSKAESKTDQFLSTIAKQHPLTVAEVDSESESGLDGSPGTPWPNSCLAKPSVNNNDESTSNQETLVTLSSKTQSDGTGEKSRSDSVKSCNKTELNACSEGEVTYTKCARTGEGTESEAESSGKELCDNSVDKAAVSDDPPPAAGVAQDTVEDIHEVTCSKEESQSSGNRPDPAECEPGPDDVAGNTIVRPPCEDDVSGNTIVRPPCEDDVAGNTIVRPPCEDDVAGNTIVRPPCEEPVKSECEAVKACELRTWIHGVVLEDLLLPVFQACADSVSSGVVRAQDTGASDSVRLQSPAHQGMDTTAPSSTTSMEPVPVPSRIDSKADDGEMSEDETKEKKVLYPDELEADVCSRLGLRPVTARKPSSVERDIKAAVESILSEVASNNITSDSNMSSDAFLGDYDDPCHREQSAETVDSGHPPDSESVHQIVSRILYDIVSCICPLGEEEDASDGRRLTLCIPEPSPYATAAEHNLKSPTTIFKHLHLKRWNPDCLEELVVNISEHDDDDMEVPPQGKVIRCKPVLELSPIPSDNFSAISFGSHGQVNFICGVCKKPFVDRDSLLRHHLKKHPSIDFSCLAVENGNDIDLLFYTWPCNYGLLASAQPFPDDCRNLDVYTCTRCGSVFKHIHRLHVHIINCDPKNYETLAAKRRKYRRRMRKQMMEVMTAKKSQQAQGKPGTGITQLPRKPGRPKGSSGVRKPKVESPAKNRKRRNYELLYNPHNHVRRREMTDVVATHQCRGCQHTFKTLSLLERHAKKCSEREKLQRQRPVQSLLLEDVAQKPRHTCRYCAKHFTYLKSLANHYRAFCSVRKARQQKGLMTSTDFQDEEDLLKLIKQLEVDKVETKEAELEIMDGRRKKGGWPRGMKRKNRRKKHCWTYVKKKKLDEKDEENGMVDPMLWNPEVDWMEQLLQGQGETEEDEEEEEEVEDSVVSDKGKTTANSGAKLSKVDEKGDKEKDSLLSKPHSSPSKTSSPTKQKSKKTSLDESGDMKEDKLKTTSGTGSPRKRSNKSPSATPEESPSKASSSPIKPVTEKAVVNDKTGSTPEVTATTSDGSSTSSPEKKKRKYVRKIPLEEVLLKKKRNRMLKMSMIGQGSSNSKQAAKLKKIAPLPSDTETSQRIAAVIEDVKKNVASSDVVKPALAVKTPSPSKAVKVKSPADDSVVTLITVFPQDMTPTKSTKDGVPSPKKDGVLSPKKGPKLKNIQVSLLLSPIREKSPKKSPSTKKLVLLTEANSLDSSTAGNKVDMKSGKKLSPGKNVKEISNSMKNDSSTQKVAKLETSPKKLSAASKANTPVKISPKKSLLKSPKLPRNSPKPKSATPSPKSSPRHETPKKSLGKKTGSGQTTPTSLVCDETLSDTPSPENAKTSPPTKCVSKKRKTAANIASLLCDEDPDFDFDFDDSDEVLAKKRPKPRLKCTVQTAVVLRQVSELGQESDISR